MKYLFSVICVFLLCTSCVKDQALTKADLYPSLKSENDSLWQKCADRLYISMQKQASYLLGTVRSLNGNDNIKLLTEYGKEEENIRPNVTAVAGFAFLYTYGDYNPLIVGIERNELKEQFIIPMMRCMIRKHIMGRIRLTDRSRWGGQFQSAHWAYILGRGAYWMWNDLPKDICEGILRIVSYEADIVLSKMPPMQLEFDTKCEENAWNAQILAIAPLLMPLDTRCELWREAQKKWVVSAYIRPIDLLSDKNIDGVNLSSFNEANLFDDYTLENHGIVHPDYMSSFILSAQIALDYKMRGVEIPDFLKFGIQGLYDNLKYLILPDGGLYYPSGQDWRIFRNADWILNHALMNMIFQDKDSYDYANQCMDTIERMQERNPQGNTYSKGEYFFSSTQEHLLFWWCNAWLAMQFNKTSSLKSKPNLGIRDLVYGKIVMNKTEKSIHSLSYGKNLMLLVGRNQKDRLFSPENDSGFGTIILENEQPVGAKLKNISLETDSTSFKALLDVAYGNRVKGVYRISSSNDTLSVQETLIATSDLNIKEIATSSFFLLNNPYWIYEQHKRIIQTPKNHFVFNPVSKKDILFSANRLLIDSSVVIISSTPLNCRYKGAETSEKARYYDQLCINYRIEKRKFLRNEIVSEISYKMIFK
ncbi:MAG: hypothetical protein RR202_05765 [Bacteroidales bacterium]